MNDIVVFNQVEADLANYKAENEKIIFDYEDSVGNKAARSHVQKLRGIKTHITTIHKAAKADALAFGRALDAKRNQLWGEVDCFIKVHDDPLKRIKARKDEVIRLAAEKLAVEKQAEEEVRQKELEEREAEITRKEAEIKAKEDAILAEKEKIHLEHKRVKWVKRIAEEAKQQAEAETERKLQVAEEKRIADIEAEKQRAKDEAKNKELIEREHIEAENREKARLAEIEKKRIEDVEHRAKVEQGICEKLYGFIPDSSLVNELVQVISKGEINNLKIIY